jgi:hypothetical protein
VDSCKGALLATMPLGTANRKNAVVTLPTADVKGTGGIHDLCCEVENPDDHLTRTTGQASTAMPSVPISRRPGTTVLLASRSMATSPPCCLQLHRDSAVAETAILAGQCDDRSGQCIFVVTLRRPVALRASWPIHQSARTPFTHPIPAGTAHRTTPSFRT